MGGAVKSRLTRRRVGKALARMGISHNTHRGDDMRGTLATLALAAGFAILASGCGKEQDKRSLEKGIPPPAALAAPGVAASGQSAAQASPGAAAVSAPPAPSPAETSVNAGESLQKPKLADAPALEGDGRKPPKFLKP